MYAFGLICFFFFILFRSKLRFRATFFPTFLIFCLCIGLFCIAHVFVAATAVAAVAVVVFSLFFRSILHVFYIISKHSPGFALLSYCPRNWVVFIKFRSLFHMLQFFFRCRCSISFSLSKRNLLPNLDFPCIRFWLAFFWFLFIFLFL